MSARCPRGVNRGRPRQPAATPPAMTPCKGAGNLTWRAVTREAGGRRGGRERRSIIVAKREQTGLNDGAVCYWAVTHI